MKSVNVTCRLDPDSVAFLDKLGENLDRDRSYLIKDAVRQYIAMHRWQVEEVQKAIGEADRDEFASDSDMKAMFDELTR
jgi:RHH-type transcriptional regulator, rel operon repressor / antitoxin RelB